MFTIYISEEPNVKEWDPVEYQHLCVPAVVFQLPCVIVVLRVF